MKKSLKIILVCLLFLLFAKNWLYRTTINYTPIKERQSIQLTDQKLIDFLQDELNNKEITSDSIIQIASETTNQILQFTFQKASANPNQLIQTGKANCIGYSAMLNSIVNFLITETNLEKELEAKHLVGKIDFLGINLHQFFTDSFYKDHDYNRIENKVTGTITIIDPSINDYLRVGIKQQ